MNIKDATNKVTYSEQVKRAKEMVNKNDHVEYLEERYPEMTNEFKNIQRNSLRFSQTPQGFTFKKIYEKHKKNINGNFDDDSSLFTNDGEKVRVISGSKKNLKITDKEDLDIFNSIKRSKSYSGIGFDIHRLIKGKKLFLGGIKIPYHSGLKGHSDGDVILHAIIDAILGAIRKKDIGTYFPNTKKFKNIRSPKMLKPIINNLYKSNFLINNLDINLICEQPKVSKYRDKIINSISKFTNLNKDRINLKGKTVEKLGLIGKEKAIACEVIVSITKYD